MQNTLNRPRHALRGREISMFLSLSFLFTLTGCGDSPEEASAKNMHNLVIAAHTWADTHKGEWPDSLEQLKEIVGEDEFANAMENPLTGDNPGYEYVKPRIRIDDAGYTREVAIYQLRDGKRDLSVRVCYADAGVRYFEPPIGDTSDAPR